MPIHLIEVHHLIEKVDHIEILESYRKSSGTKLPSISNNIKILGGAAVLAIVFLLKFSPKLIGLSMEFFNFVPQNSAGTGFPFHYIIIALIAISAIATKILR